MRTALTPIERAPTLTVLNLSRVRAATMSLSLGLAIWEALSRLLHVAFMPTVPSIVKSAWRLTLSGQVPEALGASLMVLVIAYALAASIGVLAGVLIGRYRYVAIACDPYLDALLGVPNLLLVPLFFALFGLGRATEIAVVFVYAFVVIAVMTRSAAATIDPRLIEMARAFGASDRQVLRHVVLPGALPTVMAGLRLGMGRAVRGLINAEMLIGSIGLGTLLRAYGNQFDAASVFGILSVLVALALIVNGLLRALDRRLNAWIELPGSSR